MEKAIPCKPDTNSWWYYANIKDFKVRIKKEARFINIKEPIQQKHITIINLDACNNTPSNYKVKIDRIKVSTTLRKDFITFSSVADRTNRQKSNRDIEDVDNTINTFDLMQTERCSATKFTLSQVQLELSNFK